MVGDYMGTLGDVRFLPAHTMAPKISQFVFLLERTSLNLFSFTIGINGTFVT